ncbi:MAG: DUF1566 domain-containing protein, partial [Kiritimatiellota bacterium]|nr:DUF1566 domain-containing protein [Kiritimatiellota bacterium]
MWTLNDIYNVLDTRTTNVTKRAGATAFVEPGGAPTNATMHTLNEIMTLVTNRAPAARTPQTITYAVGDDGTNRVGVAWPNPRFTVQANTNCVLDNLTGLMWARDRANACGLAVAATNWNTAVTSCNDLVYGGYDDWRLPNLQELQSLLDYRWYNPPLCNTLGTAQLAVNDPFTGAASYYWSSTTFLGGGVNAWQIVYTGSSSWGNKTSGTGNVWPVRGGL